MLVIKEANQGRGSNYANVTVQLQSLIKDGNNIDIQVNPKTMGTDPSPGSKKVLSVIQVADGNQNSKEIEDGNQFAVYTTKPASAGEKTSATVNTVRDIGMTFLSFFLHIVGIGIAWRVGSLLFSKIVAVVLTALAAYIPQFGLWGVPLVVFVYRLFRSEDIPALSQMIENGKAALTTAPPTA